MKRKISLFLVLALGFSTVSAQFVFGVKPGLLANSAQFGFKVGSLQILGGLEFIRVTTTTEESGTRLDYVYLNYPPYYSYQLSPYNDKSEISTNIYIPYVGAKLLFASPEAGKAGAYLIAFVPSRLFRARA